MFRLEKFKIMKINIKNLSQYLIAKEYIGGITINDQSIYFVIFAPNSDKKILTKIEAEIPEGAIVEGEIKNVELLKPILEGMRHSAELAKIKNLYVTLSLKSGLVYHKILDLPQMDPKELVGAIDLNIKMVSPIKFEESYNDWELTGTVVKGGAINYRVSAVFGKKTLIDSYLKVLSETGFLPLAVEFNGLSAWRLFNSNNLIAQENKSNLIVMISSDGLDFAVVKSGGLQFSYFQAWQSIIRISPFLSAEGRKGNLSQSDFLHIFTEETRKVINFYFNHFQETIASAYILSPIYAEEMATILGQQFSLSVNKLPDLGYSPNYFIASGAGLRGLISRVDDVGVSLMAVGTEQEYRRRRVVNFVGLWGKIINVTAVVLTIVFVGVSLFFNTMEKDFAAEANNLTIQLNQEKFQELKAKVADFNISLNNIAQANQQVKDWSGFFKWWMDNGGALGIQKFIINSPDSLITFRGWTNTEEKLLDFKSKMENSPNFSEVDVPLASVIKQRNGVEFNLNFRINKLFPETSAITNNEGGILENTIPAEILLETPLISPETKPE